jgi:tRNA pseudouridine38-40 synthase
MQNVILHLSYDGTNYHGWQKQPGQKTVQGVIEDCLVKITGGIEKLTASARTDAGVHALDQVVNFYTSSRLTPSTMVRALNSLLSRDIVIREASWASEKFHARYSARSKLYLYLILARPYPSPFHSRYSWYLSYPLEVKKIKKAANFLIGTHDFSSFRAASCNAKTSIRHLSRLELEERGSFLLFWVEANAFLQHMVRNIIGTLVEVGRGKYEPEYVEEILVIKDRTKAGPTAPAQGLFLYKVTYEKF